MAEFKRIILFLTVILQFTAVNPADHVVKAGDNVTLSCTSETYCPERCEDINWSYRPSNLVTLIGNGEIHENIKSKAKRLSLEGNCSMVISEVIVEDAGIYACQEDKKPDKLPFVQMLSVVTFRESEGFDWVQFSCSLSPYVQCTQSVKWLITGNHSALVLDSDCSSSVMFYEQLHLPFEKMLNCVVTTNDGEVFSFPLIRQFPNINTTAVPTTQGQNTTAAPTIQAYTDAAHPVHWVMLVMRVVQFILSSVIMALLIRALGKWRQTNDNDAVCNDEDEDDVAVRYENV